MESRPIACRDIVGAAFSGLCDSVKAGWIGCVGCVGSALDVAVRFTQGWLIKVSCNMCSKRLSGCVFIRTAERALAVCGGFSFDSNGCFGVTSVFRAWTGASFVFAGGEPPIYFGSLLLPLCTAVFLVCTNLNLRDRETPTRQNETGGHRIQVRNRTILSLYLVSDFFFLRFLFRLALPLLDFPSWLVAYPFGVCWAGANGLVAPDTHVPPNVVLCPTSVVQFVDIATTGL